MKGRDETAGGSEVSAQAWHRYLRSDPGGVPWSGEAETRPEKPMSVEKNLRY